MAAGAPITLALPGRRLEGLAWGREDAPHRVLALHGWLDNAATFTLIGNTVALAADAYVVAIDFAGHGKSDHYSSTVLYSMASYCQDVVGAAQALGWERFALLGHSLGAAVASLVAGAFPGRIQALACIEGLAPRSADALSAPRNLATALSAPLDREHSKTYPDVDTAVARRQETARRIFGMTLSKAGAQLLVSRALRRTKDADGAVQWQFRHDRVLANRSASYFTQPQVEAFLCAVRCPVLLVLGTKGLLLHPQRAAMTARYVGLLRNSKVVHVRGGSHHPQCDPSTANAVERHVASFLRDTLDPTPPRDDAAGTRRWALLGFAAVAAVVLATRHKCFG